MFFEGKIRKNKKTDAFRLRVFDTFLSICAVALLTFLW